MDVVRRSPRNAGSKGVGNNKYVGKNSVRALNQCFDRMSDENCSPRKKRGISPDDEDRLPPSKVLRTTEPPITPPKLAIKSFYSPRNMSQYQSPVDRAIIRSSNPNTPSPLLSPSNVLKKKLNSPPIGKTRGSVPKMHLQKKKSPAAAFRPVLGQPGASKRQKRNSSNIRKSSRTSQQSEKDDEEQVSSAPVVKNFSVLAEIPPGSPRSPVKNIISSSKKFFLNRSPRRKKTSQVHIGKGFNLSFQGRVPKSLQKKVQKESNKRTKKPLTFTSTNASQKSKPKSSPLMGNLKSRRDERVASLQPTDRASSKISKTITHPVTRTSDPVATSATRANTKENLLQSQELFSDYSNAAANSNSSTQDTDGSIEASRNNADEEAENPSCHSSHTVPVSSHESPGSLNLLTEESPTSSMQSETSCVSAPSGKRFFPIFVNGNTPKNTPPSTPNSCRSLRSKFSESDHGTPQNGSVSSPASSRGSTRRSPKLLKKLVDKKGKEQMLLDFGQKWVGTIQCEACGLVYTPGEPTDEATHSKFHQRMISALKFPGWKKERVLQEFPDGSRIIVVMPDEKQAMKKVETVRKIVDEDLGFVVEAPSTKSNTKNFLYISAEEKKVVGFCIAEVISKAYRVIGENESDVSESQQEGGRAWCCRTSPEPARCGINRIWVLRSQRRHKIASKLLDCIRCNFMMGVPMRKEELAFTDPTPDGKVFASNYTGTAEFLVYKHRS